MIRAIDDGGAAFSVIGINNGMSLRDYFAAHAVVPTDSEIEMQMRLDKNRNPHNESHKPKPRTRREIIADLAFEYADAMLKARVGKKD